MNASCAADFNILITMSEISERSAVGCSVWLDVFSFKQPAEKIKYEYTGDDNANALNRPGLCISSSSRGERCTATGEDETAGAENDADRIDPTARPRTT